MEQYRIKYKQYHYTGTDRLRENIVVAKAWAFEIEHGFVGIWIDRNRNQYPDIAVNVNDVLTIEPIEEE